ncbi:PREDICTED: E3 ubiquitin-protein ligase At3g02290-like [Camelina sativa]|uniref:RING-type E3 ubiquitin transferase n=1 Tax=Camelina sativa TaxID=90675 RepID=A0ABM0XXJ0_CAMSA|nr:PREDICTED: E3 ubiquitin-protein ligase At3g02290-like [Camelina sativa]
MGCVTSCFRVDDFEDYPNPTSSSVNRNCPCPRCLVNSLLNLYVSLFRRGETRSLPSSLQATTTNVSITSSTSYDNFMSNTFHSTPRPLPYDADPRCFRSRRDSLVSRRDKGSSYSHEEAEPLRSDTDFDSESFSVEGSKWANNKLIISGEVSKEEFSKSTRRILKSKTMAIGDDEGMYITSDDEDVCPTCLEEYTSENPKIVTNCSHHFHLSCIYEWMERSENCPVCGKVMEFNETP